MTKRKEGAWINKDGLPTRSGVYRVENSNYREDVAAVEVYRHWKKGLCCFSEDINLDSSQINIDSRYDCHVSVQFTGLKFVKYLGPCKSNN